MGQIRWRAILFWAVAGTAMVVAVTLINTSSTYHTLGGLVDTGPHDPEGPVMHHDMPSYPELAGGGHDGADFYVIARQPMHPTKAAAELDRPRYRLQRIGFPWLVWVLHPTGGGLGLIWSMFAVGVAGVLAGCVASGALSMRLGGPAWPALAFALVPGTFESLRISTPDPLAFAFVLWALYFLLRRRLWWAVLFGVAAGLTKETGLLFLFGFLLWRRDRDALIATAIPTAVVGAWWLWLRHLFPHVSNQVQEFVSPLSGWSDAIKFWGRGYEPIGMVSAVAAVVVCVLALAVGRLRHPFGWSILLSLLMFVVLSANTLGPERNAGRTTLGAFVLAVIVLATYRTAEAALAEPAASDTSSSARDPATPLRPTTS